MAAMTVDDSRAFAPMKYLQRIELAFNFSGCILHQLEIDLERTINTGRKERLIHRVKLITVGCDERK